MRTISLTAALATLATLVTLSAATHARAQASDPVSYSLREGSHLEYGCMGPCECALIFVNPLKGSFTLRRTGVDPLYTHYEIANVQWVYTVGDSAALRTVHVRGQGTYDVGGEFAALQRMVLDLTTDDALVQHFDSGLVPARAPFPQIDIDVHTHPEACFDSLIRVVAAPQGFAGVSTPWPSRLLEGPVPNPSSGVVQLTFAPKQSGHALVDVVDVGGRVVRQLLDRSVTAGVYSLRWDGHTAQGGGARPGIYWVRARLGDLEERQRIARVR